jgi:hypothetical protein
MESMDLETSVRADDREVQKRHYNVVENDPDGCVECRTFALEEVDGCVMIYTFGRVVTD